MNHSVFIAQVNTLKSFKAVEHKKFKDRRAIRKQTKKIKKMIIDAAKAQSSIVYQQTIDLYEQIVEANLE